jgi:hypothetical protein
VRKKARVRFEFKTRGMRHWHRLRRKPVEADGTFATWPRLTRPAHTSRNGGRRGLRLRDRRVSTHARLIRIRAVVQHVGHSRVVRVYVYHRRSAKRNKKSLRHKVRHHQVRHHQSRSRQLRVNEPTTVT